MGRQYTAEKIYTRNGAEQTASEWEGKVDTDEWYDVPAIVRKSISRKLRWCFVWRREESRVRKVFDEMTDEDHATLISLFTTDPIAAQEYFVQLLREQQTFKITWGSNES